MPVRQRIKRTADFQAVRQNGWKNGRSHFFLQILVQDAAQGNPVRKLGVIASRRVGNAVARNRCKRLMREVFRRCEDQLPHRCEVVMVARGECAKAGYKEVEADFLQLMERFNLWQARQTASSD